MRWNYILCRWFGHGGNLKEVCRTHRSSLLYCFRCHSFESCDLPERWVQS